MAIEETLAILGIGAAVVYHGAQSVELKLIVKWAFFVTFLFSAFEIMINNGADTSLPFFFVAALIIVVVLFVIDAVMLIPMGANLIRKRMTR